MIYNLMVFNLFSGKFTLVNSTGNTLEDGEFGLLLIHGGTVCDSKYFHSFDNNAAHAICNSMG
jgi:hypothetical protein